MPATVGGSGEYNISTLTSDGMPSLFYVVGRIFGFSSVMFELRDGSASSILRHLLVLTYATSRTALQISGTGLGCWLYCT
eukprot:2343206-Rhodomonas_salina.1